MALEKTIDVLGIGNAIIDVLADADDAFLLQHNLNKGSMTLVDEEASSNIYSSMKNKYKCQEDLLLIQFMDWHN